MKKQNIIWIGSVLGASAVVALFLGEIRKPSTVRTISVSGECLTSAPKDKTAITLRVTTLDKNAAKSMKIATAKMAEITDFLKTKTVDMQTTEFDSHEKTEWNYELKKSEKLGFETVIAVQVSSDNIVEIESVLNKFAGDKDVFAENFHMFTSTKTLKPIMEKCLSEAIENARARANALVAPDKQKAGKLLYVSYGSNAGWEHILYAEPRMKTAALEFLADEAINTGGSFVSKDTEISVSVSAVFEIK